MSIVRLDVRRANKSQLYINNKTLGKVLEHYKLLTEKIGFESALWNLFMKMDKELKTWNQSHL